MRKYRRLTRKDRIAIELKLENGKTQSEIASDLGVHRSTINREIKRNKAVHGRYKWRGAEVKSQSNRRNRIFYKRKIEGPLEELVSELLAARLSPDQISRRLRLEGSRWQVSHETIYKWIYYIAPQFKVCLRWKTRLRQKRTGKYRRGLRGLPRKFIDTRPRAANLRIEKGHWERDLLEGLKGKSSLLVLQDRFSRLTVLRKVFSKKTEEVNRVTMDALKGQLVKTITNDNGFEFGNYQALENELNTRVYYCHAYASWERGMVENTNGLLRQYLPKKTDLDSLKEKEIRWLEDQINSRPRQTLGYRSAKEVHGNRKFKIVKGERYYRSKMLIRETEALRDYFMKENAL